MTKKRASKPRKRRQPEEKQTGMERMGPLPGAAAGIANLLNRLRHRRPEMSWNPRRITTSQQIREVLELVSKEQPEPDNLKARPLARTVSGWSWMSHFPMTESVDTLDATFASNVRRFASALEEGGANAAIISTRIPPERAYLMHWAWRIAKGGYDPRQVPDMSGVYINWWHGDLEMSRRGALEMVKGYDLETAKSPPPLVSPYTQGKVVVMHVSWLDELYLKDTNGEINLIQGAPRNGHNYDLAEVAKMYRLLRLVFDPLTEQVHWLAGGDY
jgi:hypothetical protein